LLEPPMPDRSKVYSGPPGLGAGVGLDNTTS